MWQALFPSLHLIHRLYLNELKLECREISFAVIKSRWYVEGLFSEFVPRRRLFFATGMAILREHWGMALQC
jgi:hypothetical protein